MSSLAGVEGTLPLGRTELFVKGAESAVVHEALATLLLINKSAEIRTDAKARKGQISGGAWKGKSESTKDEESLV